MAEFTYDELGRLVNNPNRIVSTMFDLIEQSIETSEVGTLNGEVDPFTYCVDMIIGMNNIYLNRLEDAVSTGYLIHARTIADLAKHMSDDDWVGVFAEPSETTVRFLIPLSEIDRLALDYSTLDNDLLNFYRKLVIPKDTLIKIIDVEFWLEHAVEIRVMEHGGIQVLYDTTQTSPFKSLGTNYPEREFITLSGQKFLAVYLPVRQVAIKEIPNKASNSSVGFSLVQAYEDKLYKVRAFIQPWGSTTRQEMTVIFNRDSYDANYPTLTIDLLDNNQFRASIPTVYLENGRGLGDVTLLVYTTKGVYERDLRNLTQNYYSPAYYNFERSRGALSDYEVPVLSLDGVLVSSYAEIAGGDNGKTFEELKNTLVYAHRRRDIPVSPTDLTQTFLAAGYSMIKSIDYPNSRLYRVTKPLPVQESKKYDK